MIDANTKPLLVTSAARSAPTVHFASGDNGSTMPYCQIGQRRTPDQSAAVRARFGLTAGRLMNCEGCAEMVFKHPAWAANHHPLMDPSLRWI
jgi:hypothetical protein